MNKLLMYAIYDELDGYTMPIPFGSEEIAIRWYLTMKETNVDMKHNESNYSLWFMGTFDKKKGEFISECKQINV